MENYIVHTAGLMLSAKHTWLWLKLINLAEQVCHLGRPDSHTHAVPL